MQQTGLQSIWS